MREFEERRKVKKLLHSRYAIAALLVVLLLLSRGVWGAYQKYARSEEIAQRIEEEYSTLQEKEASLRSALSDLETEEGREREVRDRFGAVKEGERLIILVDDEAPAKQTVRFESRGLWQRIKDLFTRD
ncbi:MAG: septum formation initiator family protein [Candidatus Taylorbacteria bacterium]|nr:septum formation initiator family protein [Candidatus Taylorbacteria bacterium]